MAQITFDLVAGPTFRTALDVLEFSEQMFDLIPQWHAAERAELQSRCEALMETVVYGLKVKQ